MAWSQIYELMQKRHNSIANTGVIYISFALSHWNNIKRMSCSVIFIQKQQAWWPNKLCLHNNKSDLTWRNILSCLDQYRHQIVKTQEVRAEPFPPPTLNCRLPWFPLPRFPSPPIAQFQLPRLRLIWTGWFQLPWIWLLQFRLPRFQLSRIRLPWFLFACRWLVPHSHPPISYIKFCDETAQFSQLEPWFQLIALVKAGPEKYG